MAQALIAAGASLNARAKDGFMPLQMAAQFNENPDVISALLDAGVDPGTTEWGGMLPHDHTKGNDAVRGSDS